MSLKYFILLVIVPQLSLGATYYLSPAGSDTNPGTLSKPWKTLDRLQDAQSILKAGDIIYFRGGNYIINDSTKRDYYSWNSAKTATAAAPISYKNYPGEKPIIVGDRRTKSPGTLIYLQNYVTIDGLTFQETSGQRLAGGHGDDPNKRHNGYAWTAISTWATGVAIRNVSIQGWTLGMFYAGSKIIFEKNRITNTRSHRLYISGSSGIFRNNILEGTYGYWNQQGFQVQYLKAVGNKIHNNIIYEGKANGFVLSGQVSNNNVFINPGNKSASVSGPGVMIGLWCEDGPTGLGNKVYNNTFMGMTKNAVLSDPLTPKCNGIRPASRVEMRDNIFYPSNKIAVGLTQNYTNIKNNIFYNISNSAPSGNRLVDPLLVNSRGTTSASAMLRSGSPAIDAGKSTLFPSSDYNGRKRPQGKTYDIGAFEY